MIALDCTFRDGGYYNEWKFDVGLANRYLHVMENSGLDAIEIGFRSPGKHNFVNVSDEFIDGELFVPDVSYFGVMVNNNEMNSKVIKKEFGYSDEAPINLVRSATHFKDLSLAEEVCKSLKDLGYTVCCNLMQAATKSFDEISTAAEKISKWGSVDVLYLADSLGGMDHDAVNYAYKAIWNGWDGLTGFHGHNNKGQALSNSLEAVDVGVGWIDSTILGMGRGPGNTETEYLLSELNKRGFGEFKLEEVYDLAMGEFFSIKKQYNWGPSLPYYLAAEYDIHPIYIQRMLVSNYPIPAKRMLKAIFLLRDQDSSSFDHDKLRRALI